MIKYKRLIVIASSAIIIGGGGLMYFYKNKAHEIKFENEGSDTDEHQAEGLDYRNNKIDKIIDFTIIDSFASSINNVKTIDELAKTLSIKCRSDIEKARAIYIWLTKNINYDDIGYNNNSLKRDYSAEAVFINKYAVCEGFSNLYLTLGLKMNLQIEKINGYAKGYSYTKGSVFKKTNHAWNRIKINNEWKIFDATWGQGFAENKNGKSLSIKKFNDNWFDVNPYIAIFSHYPDAPDLVTTLPFIDLKTYEAFPQIDFEYFNLGFSPLTAYQDLFKNNTLKTPQCFENKPKIAIKTAPKYDILEIGKSYLFEIVAPKIIDMALVDSQNNWTFFNLNNGIYKINFTPKNLGKLDLSVKYQANDKLYMQTLIYHIEKTNVSISPIKQQLKKSKT